MVKDLKILKITFVILVFLAVLIAVFSLYSNKTDAYARADDEPPAFDYTITIFPKDNRETETFGRTLTYTLIITNAPVGYTASWQWSVKHTGEEDFQVIAGADNKGDMIITNVSDSGVYRCTVRVGSQGNIVEKSFERLATINPRSERVNWSSEQIIYNGKTQYQPYTVISGVTSQAVPNDITGKGTEAGTYTATVTSLDPNYVLTNNVREYTIARRPTPVVWDEIKSFIYNGAVQYPNAAAYDVNGDRLNIEITAAGKNFSTNPYAAEASVTDTNYQLTGATCTYYILKKEIAVVWSDIELVYNGKQQSPAAVAIGLEGTNVVSVQIGITDGIDVKADGYEAFAQSQDTNYQLSNEHQTFFVRPLAVEVVWGRRAGSAVTNVTLININRWSPDNPFVYNTNNQFTQVAARFLNTAGSYGDLTVTLLGNSVMRDAGVYTLEATMPSSVVNYALADYTVSSAVITVEKAKPYIIAEETVYEFVHTGEAISLDITASSYEPILIKINGVTCENSFIDQGRYYLEITTYDTNNYFPAESVFITVIIRGTNFSSADGTASLVLHEGADPAAILSINEIDESEIRLSGAPWVRKIEAAYRAVLNIDDLTLDINSSATITLKVPDEFSDYEMLRIITMKDGRYEEQIVENENGYITIEIYESGIFAITTINESMLAMWWFIIIAVFVAIAAIVVFTIVIKNRKYR